MRRKRSAICIRKHRYGDVKCLNVGPRKTKRIRPERLRCDTLSVRPYVCRSVLLEKEKHVHSKCKSASNHQNQLGKGTGDDEITGTVFAQFGGLSSPKYSLSILKHCFGRHECILSIGKYGYSTLKRGFSKPNYILSSLKYDFSTPECGFSRHYCG